MKLQLTFVLLLLIYMPLKGQSDTRQNFPQTYWEQYIGVYSEEKNSEKLVLVSLTWSERLIVTDLRTYEYDVLTKDKDHNFAAGDSLQVIFEVQDGRVNKMALKADNRTDIFRKKPITLEEMEFKSEGNVIKGTLLLPEDIKRPLPLVVVHGGASWIVRDTNLQEALYYVSLGMAALVYDKQGWGESTGDKDASFHSLATDIHNIAHALSYRTDINPKKIGISTYSQSGWYGPLASSKSDYIQFQILNVPAATTVYHQEKQRIENELKADGFPEVEINTALKLFEAISDFNRYSADWSKIDQLKNQNDGKEWMNYLFIPRDSSEATWKWGRRNWMYNSLPVLTQTLIPSLVIFGEKDLKVPAEVNVPIFYSAFEMAGNRNYHIEVIPDMNHSFLITDKRGRKSRNTRKYPARLFTLKKEWLQNNGVLNPNR